MITLNRIKLQVLNLNLKIIGVKERQPRIMHYKRSIVKMAITQSKLQNQWNLIKITIVYCDIKKKTCKIHKTPGLQAIKTILKIITNKGTTSPDFKTHWKARVTGNVQQNCQDGSVQKCTSCQAWWPKVNPMIHTVRENQLLRVVLWPPHVHCTMCSAQNHRHTK